MAKSIYAMCIDTTSQPVDIIFGWSIDNISVAVGRETVLDHIFDNVGAYNVCVDAFNSGEPLLRS